jgi:hypothetical protein
MEDALLRLENAILEETRMVAAEALKGIHALQGIFEDRMRGKKGVLQGLDERTKVVGQRDINSTQITVQLVVVFTIHNVFMVRCRERGRSESDGK